MAFVTIRIKGVEGYTRSDLDKERLVVGRSSTAGLPIKHTSISREHFVLLREGEKWLVEDLGSANGTRINDTQVVGRAVLNEKDIIKAGQARITFHGGNLADAEAAIEITSRDDGGAGPTRKQRSEDPPEAIPCDDCQGWFSIAHRLAGETMTCPHCGRPQLVPTLVS